MDGANDDQATTICSHCEQFLLPIVTCILFTAPGIWKNVKNIRPPERAAGGVPRRQPREFSRRRLLFTIAITGIAVLLGSIFFQRKSDPSRVN